MYLVKALLMFALATALAFFADLEYAAKGITVMFTLLAACTLSAGIIAIHTLHREY